MEDWESKVKKLSEERNFEHLIRTCLHEIEKHESNLQSIKNILLELQSKL